MKRFLLFLSLFLITGAVHARQIVLNIPDQDIRIVENDVVDAEQWIKDAWAGKLSKCKERIIKAEIDKSLQEGTAIPVKKDEIVAKALSRPQYKNRKQRDASSTTESNTKSAH